MPELQRTPLYDLHVSLGAKMVPFAGYDMPVQYGLGVMKEHLWTREHAGLFDVSHMGQIWIEGSPDPGAAIEKLVPQSIAALQAALEKSKSPNQGVRLRFELARRLRSADRPADAYSVLSELLGASPKYRDPAGLHRELASLAKAAENPEAEKRHQDEISALEKNAP